MNKAFKYLYNYPQLSLGVRKGMSQSEEYRNIVRRGIMPEDLSFPFELSGEEDEYTLSTPAGEVDVLYLPDRSIFEYFIKVLAHRNEPVELPASMGASLISGINNWRKIYAHKEEYEQNGNTDWDEEFSRFISVKENYKDTVLIVSKGYYSAIKPECIDMDSEEWIDKSKSIRIYHEISHYISRKLFIENKEALRDEIVADAMGFIAAFGYYDKALAEIVLGIEKEELNRNGRLVNYVSEEELKSSILRAHKIIDALDQYIESKDLSNVFDLLLDIEKEKVAIWKID
ncbi:MAG: DUF7005 family protein [Erysipelotrichaceae bacterium]